MFGRIRTRNAKFIKKKKKRPPTTISMFGKIMSQIECLGR